MLDLSKLMVETKEVWVDYPDVEGFKVKVVALSRKELTSLRKRCVTTSYVRKSKDMAETLDEEMFVQEFSNATIKGWEGLTLEILESLILLDTTGQDLTMKWEYNQANANTLVTNSTEFDTWLNEVVFDLDNFRSKPKRASDGKVGPTVP